MKSRKGPQKKNNDRSGESGSLSQAEPSSFKHLAAFVISFFAVFCGRSSWLFLG
jgi:hypothetical protein